MGAILRWIFVVIRVTIMTEVTESNVPCCFPGDWIHYFGYLVISGLNNVTGWSPHIETKGKSGKHIGNYFCLQELRKTHENKIKQCNSCLSFL